MFKRAAGGSKPALRIAIAPLSKVLCSKFSAQTQELHTFQIAFEMLCEGSSLADENREAIQSFDYRTRPIYRPGAIPDSYLP